MTGLLYFAGAARPVRAPGALPGAPRPATILVMGVTYELIDAPYPYLCAVYRCRCGAVAVRHANESATPPELWERAPDCADADYLCPHCAEQRRAGAHS